MRINLENVNMELALSLMEEPKYNRVAMVARAASDLKIMLQQTKINCFISLEKAVASMYEDMAENILPEYITYTRSYMTILERTFNWAQDVHKTQIRKNWSILTIRGLR
jgi:hypothetical protein